MTSRVHFGRLLAELVLVAFSLPSAALCSGVTRPRNVAVSPYGIVAVVTSTNTDSVAVKNATSLSFLELGGPSWGVCFVDMNWAVVTHPTRPFMTKLARFGSSMIPAGTIAVPYYCTEVIRSATPGRVLVANRGTSPSGAESWQHAVFEIDTSTGAITKTFVTEREPRGMAFSPDSTVLYVGHIQGAMHGSGLGTPRNLGSHQHAVFDGGSIVSFDYATMQPIDRFAVGSPVRDVAVWPTWDVPLGARPAGGAYRVYCTHVGDASQSEDPGFGGRSIPNVVSSISFDADHNPLEWHDAVFQHLPNLDPVDYSDPKPAILHERLTFRWKDLGGESWARELWVTNAASGTVSRANLSAAGDLVTSGTLDLRTADDCPGCPIPVATSRDANQVFTSDAKVTPGIATVVFDQIAPAVHLPVDRSGTSASDRFTSRPTGIAFDPWFDRIWTATMFDHELVEIDPATPQVAAHHVLGSEAVNADEKDFFTFGRGFDFREAPALDGGLDAPKVQTQSCATCHVDGHLDGKVRVTVRNQLNIGGAGALSKPVAVPSVFDVGQTEWIFFEGLKTIVDARPGDQSDGHIYLQFDEAGIFTDTPGFTNVVASPMSAYAPSGTLNTVQEWGRYYFQRMNCTRCHGGPTGSTFDRVFNGGANPTPPLVDTGPFPVSLVTQNRLLHDATQSFVTGPGGGRVGGEGVSFRNLVDVGTRPANDGSKNGINTPALAGAWDNAPYFHDGRYRTLEEVLANTWLDVSGGDTLAVARKAPLLGLVDTSFDGNNGVLDFVGEPEPSNPLSTPLTSWQTHAPSRPSGRISVAEYLAPLGAGQGTAQAALLEFMRGASSRTDLCDPVQVTGFWGLTYCDGTSIIQWSTSSPVPCIVKHGRSDQWAQAVVETTQVGTAHQLFFPVVLGKSYRAEITIDKATLPPANNPVCRTTPEVTNKYWSTKNCIEPEAPKLFATHLLRATPNPFNPSTSIDFTLEARGPVKLRIFDLRGRLLRTLVDGSLDPGRHAVEWGGEVDGGGQAASGVYFATFEAGVVVENLRLVLLK